MAVHPRTIFKIFRWGEAIFEEFYHKAYANSIEQGRPRWRNIYEKIPISEPLALAYMLAYLKLCVDYEKRGAILGYNSWPKFKEYNSVLDNISTNEWDRILKKRNEIVTYFILTIA